MSQESTTFTLSSECSKIFDVSAVTPLKNGSENKDEITTDKEIYNETKVPVTKTANDKFANELAKLKQFGLNATKDVMKLLELSNGNIECIVAILGEKTKSASKSIIELEEETRKLNEMLIPNKENLKKYKMLASMNSNKKYIMEFKLGLPISKWKNKAFQRQFINDLSKITELDKENFDIINPKDG